MDGGGVFGSELMEMIGSGCSLVAGTVAADGEPRATRAWATSVVDAGACRLRVVMSADDTAAVDNLRTGRFALTGANVRTLRSVQLKGRVVAVEPATPEDVDMVVEQSSAFFCAVNQTDGNPIGLLERLLPADVVVVELEVDEMYDQSPGPGAGAAVGR
jgi:hypothetical protein